MEMNTILSRNDDMLHAPVGTEKAVMMSVQGGMYFGLDTVGSRLWELLESPQSIGQLCTRLCAEFEVEAEACRADVMAFADQLVANGVVHADPA